METGNSLWNVELINCLWNVNLYGPLIATSRVYEMLNWLWMKCLNYVISVDCEIPSSIVLWDTVVLWINFVCVLYFAIKEPMSFVFSFAIIYE